MFSRRLLISALTLLMPIAALAAPSRTSIAVMNLKNASGVTQGDAELLSDRLRIELFNTGMYSVMERSQMQEILKEQGFQMSGACTDEGCMVEMGQVLGVTQLIGGSIGRLGNMYLVNLRSIDIKTAKITGVVSEDIQGSIENLVHAFPRIAAKLAHGPDAVLPPKKPVQTKPADDDDSDSPPPPAPVPQATGAGEALDCDDEVYLVTPTFTVAQCGFDSLTADRMRELNEEIADDLLDHLNVCLMDDVVLATENDVAATKGCKSLVIRVSLNSYTTEPGSREQIKGTAEVVLNIYAGTDAAQPFQQQVYKETGSQHWGEYEPFENAFEAIGDEIEDRDLGQEMRALRKMIREL